MKVILCVTNDITTDRRVCRIARSLLKVFEKVTGVGRYRPDTLEPPDLPFGTERLRLVFSKSFLFYAEYNVRLFLYLLFKKADVLVANDLDTLPAVWLASRVKRTGLVFDSHEYFTEVPELEDRPFVKGIWRAMESFFLPGITDSYTVCNSIAHVYKSLYGIEMKVIRNLPVRRREGTMAQADAGKKGKVIIYQGSLNEGRGLELAIMAVSQMNDTRLVIVGEGDIREELQSLVQKSGSGDKVSFAGRVLPEDLFSYTSRADLGISLERHTGLSYFYSLPNKLFDYIQAEIPVMVSDMPEMAGVVEHYGVGMVTGTNDPAILASLFAEVLHDDSIKNKFRAGLKTAAAELCWENEENKLLDIYRKVIREAEKK